jgi:hypothetical protein
MRWLRTVFDARAVDRARRLEKLRAFFVARADGHIARGRPKACDPGAAARATDGWTMLPLSQGRRRRP